MSDRWAVALAAAAAAGALRPAALPLLLVVAVAVAGLRVRIPLLLCVGVLLTTSALAQRALDGLDGVEPALVAGDVTLLGDPRPSGAGLRVDVRLGGRRVEARARGALAAELAPRLAGEVLRIRGELTAAPADAPWLVPRHVGGRLALHRIDGWRPGDPISRLANAARRIVLGGTASLSAAQRSLYAGLVVGDDRAQPVTLSDDFLGAGLTHLVAVSGQNVAFTLALTGPLLRRVRLWPRLLGVLVVIALFGLITRFEPSVLRASAMAALATTAVTIGQPVSRVRIIALATTGLFLVDPLLVHSVGFRLSLAAAAAIVVLGPSIIGVLPGPAPLREALGVTVAAQLGVAPVLLSTFGPIPVASFPANLLAVPVAGLVMAWGFTGGACAGLAGEPLASLLHRPTALALGWLELVAARASSAPLGELHLVHLAALAGGLWLASRARGRASWRVPGLAVGAAAIAAAVLSGHAGPPLRTNSLVGLVRWHDRGTDVVVVGGVGSRLTLTPRAALEALRRDGVRSIELLVVADRHVPPGVLAAIVDAHAVGDVVTHSSVDTANLPVPATPAPAGDTVLPVGALEVRLVAVADRLVVDGRRRPP